MSEVTLSSKNQIVIPAEARKALKLKPGDKLLVFVHDHHIMILERPRSFEKAIRGLGRGLYPPDYLERERQSWE
jgi:AbrB family looped-hinge helix DNA binding protein